MIQNVGWLSPQGFGARFAPTCGSSPTSWRATARTIETRVVRDFRKINGHQPRKKDDHDCLDPNPSGLNRWRSCCPLNARNATSN
jgi:hypothetical protein